ncbi:MAG: hypothetical protein J2P36_07865, partial [Ktedonobacteraceae bacterium]|nr:hypothetical protein [Ktedonobacteraceae bacterium]
MGEIEALIDALRQHIPSAEIISDIDKLRECTIDGVIPRLIVTPGTVEETAQTVALINQHGLTLLAHGNGSQINL